MTAGPLWIEALSMTRYFERLGSPRAPWQRMAMSNSLTVSRRTNRSRMSVTLASLGNSERCASAWRRRRPCRRDDNASDCQVFFLFSDASDCQVVFCFLMPPIVKCFFVFCVRKKTSWAGHSFKKKKKLLLLCVLHQLAFGALNLGRP